METASGIALGTPAYMAPEQVRGQAADHRCDIFAFGAVLYELLEGHRPFAGDSSVETMNAILTEEPAPHTRASPLVAEIVRHCLEKEPGERFQSARDLGFQLRLARHPSTRTAAARPALSARPRRHATVASVMVLLLAAVVTFRWWTAREGRPDSTPTITRLTSFTGLTTDAALSRRRHLVWPTRRTGPATTTSTSGFNRLEKSRPSA